MIKPLQHFSIFYLNFEKVFEIAMLFDNKVPVSQEEMGDSKHTSKLTARVQAMLTAIFTARGEGSYEYTKSSGLKKTVEIKSTNAVILRDVVEEIKTTDEQIKMAFEDQLIIIHDLNLTIVNEEEMRQMKLIKQGALDRFTHEDISIGEVIKSFVTDYSYILTAKKEEENYLLKIPSEVQNEFENNYTIDDLLMGKVTLIGIYKGVKKMSDLKSTFKYMIENEQNKTLSEVQHSTENGQAEELAETKYHYIDTLAIVQKLRLGDS